MTMLRERASVERASEELEKLAATNRQQKTRKGCEGHAFSKAGDACVAVGVSTREDAWITSGERESSSPKCGTQSSFGKWRK